MILDATKDPIARFVSHFCESNCEILKRLVKKYVAHSGAQLLWESSDC
jgi:CTP:phosphocholine cytidylyltransferase-like protein